MNSIDQNSFMPKSQIEIDSRIKKTAVLEENLLELWIVLNGNKKNQNICNKKTASSVMNDICRCVIYLAYLQRGKQISIDLAFTEYSFIFNACIKL